MRFTRSKRNFFYTLYRGNSYAISFNLNMIKQRGGDLKSDYIISGAVDKNVLYACKLHRWYIMQLNIYTNNQIIYLYNDYSIVLK